MFKGHIICVQSSQQHSNVKELNVVLIVLLRTIYTALISQLNWTRLLTLRPYHQYVWAWNYDNFCSFIFIISIFECFFLLRKYMHLLNVLLYADDSAAMLLYLYDCLIWKKFSILVFFFFFGFFFSSNFGRNP